MRREHKTSARIQAYPMCTKKRKEEVYSSQTKDVNPTVTEVFVHMLGGV
jgi:hypothetical protein